MYERIKNLRIDKDMTQKQMADILHVDQSTYSDYENGKINIPVEALIKISECHETSVDYLIGKTDRKEPYPKDKKS